MIYLQRIEPKQIAALSTTLNIGYAVGNLLLGIREPSRYLLALGTYYFLLCVMRLTVLLPKKPPTARTQKWVGALLMTCALPLGVTAILCAFREVGTKFHMIVMIAMAAYAFSKITMAIVGICRSKKRRTHAEHILKSISLADAAVSIAALQRSMRVSFEGMTDMEIKFFNVATGSGVCLFVFWVGWQLIHIEKHNKA